MSKGLPRSLSRGNALKQEVVKAAIAIENLAVSVTATGVAIGFGSAVIQGLPQGNILLLGAVAQVQLAGPVGGSADLTDTWSGDYGIGSTPAADATITGADVDVIPSTAVGPAVAELSPLTRGASGTTGPILDNTDGSLELNLNVLVDAADIVDSATVILTANGVLHLAYMVLGDD